MKPRPAILIAACAAVLLFARAATADAPAQVTAALQGDVGRPAAAHWLRSELYFAIGSADISDGGIGEMRWQAFLDREVTPRIPDGLTVFEAYGQWRSSRHEGTSRLRSKVLVIVHEDTPANRAAIDAIRLAWKSATHAQSVLWVSEPADVSF